MESLSLSRRFCDGRTSNIQRRTTRDQETGNAVEPGYRRTDETSQRIPCWRELAVVPGLDVGRPTRGATRDCSTGRTSLVGGAREEQQRLSARLNSLCER